MKIFETPVEFGSYRLLGKVAEGGMSEVFLATSTKRELAGQFVAIKRLKEQLNSNKPFVNLLIHEAKIGVLLNHPGIAEVYDLGSHKSHFFIAMEYVHGKSLEKVFDRIREGKAPHLPMEVTTFIILEVLRALAFAHNLKDVKGRELNIIHRDISPGNILLDYKGEVKLTDFGIATAESRLQVEFSPTAMGKIAYMPPEQVANDPVVKASDLYSLSVVYYEMITGKLPFQADSPSGLYRKIVDGKPHDISMATESVDENLKEIIERCLDKSARRRFRNAPQLFDALANVFLESKKIDFRNRAVRHFYRKKLSEYLRMIFEDEVVEELDVIQSALRASADFEELKGTQPMQVQESIEAPPEDIEDKATRRYPLTEEERKKIIHGVPAEEALQKTHRTTEFELVTIPEYELPSEEEEVVFSQITVSKKLEKINLDHDSKETLKRKLPAVEIMNSDELEQFEKQTFSGDQGSVPEHAAHVAPSDAGFSGGTEVIQGQVDEDRETSPKRKSEWKKKIALLFRYWLPTFRRWSYTIVPTVLVLYLAYSLFIYFESRLSPLVLSPTQQISSIFIGEGDTDSQRDFFKRLTDQNARDSMHSIEKFFNQEYLKYVDTPKPLVQIVNHEPEVVAQSLSKRSNLMEILQNAEVFDFLDDLGYRPKSAADVNLYIYLYPSDVPEDTFPSVYSFERVPRKGIVFVPIETREIPQSIFRIAREIGFIYGGKDKQDLETGMALVPEGLAEPLKRPMFPQNKGEIMAKDIPLGLLREREPLSIYESAVGPATAFEFGWIPMEQREKLLGN